MFEVTMQHRRTVGKNTFLGWWGYNNLENILEVVLNFVMFKKNYSDPYKGVTVVWWLALS